MEDMTGWKQFSFECDINAFAIANRFFGAGGKKHGNPLAYRDWIEGLFEFPVVPRPRGEPYNLLYFVQCVRRAAERCRIGRNIDAHEDRKEHGRPLEDGEQRVTDADMLKFMKDLEAKNGKES